MSEPAAVPAEPVPVHSIQPQPKAGAQAEAWPFVPRLRIYTERMTIDRGDLLRPVLEEAGVAVLSLVFDYGGGTRFRACEPEDSTDDDLFSFDDDSGAVSSPRASESSFVRDLRAEARAQCMVEALGAVEMPRLEDFIPPLGSVADYVVHADNDVHGICSFGAHAVPKLKDLGFVVEVDEGHAYKVAAPTAPWYAHLGGDEGSDWFSLELGVEVDGERVDLLPALIDLLEQAPPDSTLRALERRPAKYRVVRIGENKYLPFPPERLVALLRVLIDLYDGCPTLDAQAKFRKERALYLTELDEIVGDGQPLKLSGSTAVLHKARAFLSQGAPTAVDATGVNATLRPYQLEGLTWLQHLRASDVGGVLADDMGLGKTLQTIAHLAIEKASGRMSGPNLIVMPTSLVGNWEREIKKFAPQLSTRIHEGRSRHRHDRPLESYDVVITTYPVLIRDVELLKETEFHVLVLDEAQAIKNPRSRAHQAVDELRSRHRLCLSGTPVENNLDELWALFDVVAPGLLGTSEEFRSRFRYPIEREGNETQLRILRQRVAPFVLRRTKEQVAKDLPPKTELVRPIEMQGAERELYESIRVAAHAEVRGLIRKKGLVASTIAILDALMKLRQACCHPKLVKVEHARSVAESAKFDMLLEMLGQQLEQGRKVLVFSQFARMLALISEALLARGTRHALLTGATKDRQAAIDAFQNGKVDVFLISLKAGGTGLNLTRADTVIHYEPWWNPAAQAQATDRAYRIGQQNPVFVHSLIVSGSVEERMLRLQEQKRHLADAILGAGGPTVPLSEADVDDLFAPLDE